MANAKSIMVRNWLTRYIWELSVDIESAQIEESVAFDLVRCLTEEFSAIPWPGESADTHDQSGARRRWSGMTLGDGLVDALKWRLSSLMTSFVSRNASYRRKKYVGTRRRC